jgi:lysophospholipase L1-like esterase
LSTDPAAADTCACRVAFGLLRLALALAAVLAVLAAAAELALRAAGVGPRAASEASNVVPDAWTGFRLRPGVSGQEAFVTNDLGMHASRSYHKDPPPGVLRVAVLGSSVVYGINLPLADTLPSALERELVRAGRPAEVLNFGTHAYGVVNVSALLQAYVHQLRPHVVVVVVDLQVGRALWPELRPSEEPPAAPGVAELGTWRTLLARGAARSALAGVLDDPRPARRWLRRTTGLPLHPHPGLAPLGRDARSRAEALERAPEAVAASAVTPSGGVAEYERRRERELVAPLSAMAAFAEATSSVLYLVTPYGPYFRLTEDELARMSVQHFVEEARQLHGDTRAALAAEVELVTRAVRRAAGPGPARVIDMLEASRRSTPGNPPHFTPDGVHLTPEGNAALGRIVAERILGDLEARPGGAS